MAAGACKLIGKMVVKVNLVGSQSPGSRLAQVARAECSADSRADFAGEAQEPKRVETPRNRSSFVYMRALCARACVIYFECSPPFSGRVRQRGVFYHARERERAQLNLLFRDAL